MLIPIRKCLLCFILFFSIYCDSSSKTHISISGTKWYINGEITYPGTIAEGLLINVRMVNSTFEDTLKSDFDVDANTQKFINKIPEYVSAGVRAFTLCLQGGMPGYEGAVNSAFNSDGSLRQSYLNRFDRVIKACDKTGAVVILGGFYQRQDQILKDENAVRAGVVNTVKWLRIKNFTNVILEIANEYPHHGFDHEIIRTAEGIIELIKLAKNENPSLLVSASGFGDGKIDSLVAEASDFILIHFNHTPVENIPARVNALNKYNKPILCNEDDKVGKEAVQALRASLESGCSWGYMNIQVNQHLPFEFNGKKDDLLLYKSMEYLVYSPHQKL
jgi:hypothetical protein